MTDETECLQRADRLISEGVIGDRGLIASMILEAVHHERERCAKMADEYYAAVFVEEHEKGARSDLGAAIRAGT